MGLTSKSRGNLTDIAAIEPETIKEHHVPDLSSYSSTATHLECKECQRHYPLEAHFVCEYCFGPLEVAYDYDLIKKRVSREQIAGGPPSLWRYRDFLPVSVFPKADLYAGFTPLINAPRLAEQLGLAEVLVKNDTANPTHSFKDRVVSVALAKATELGFKVAACASTGNLAGSVAAHAAAQGLPAYVFIPANLERQKIIATGIFGCNLVAVDGNYDDVNRLCTEIAAEHPWAFVNVNIRPYYAEGSKTLAYEVAEQLGWQVPDRCIVPIASGSLYTKIYKGFQELREVGLIDGQPPVLNGAQAQGCSPVAAAFDSKAHHIRPVKPDTIAKSLAIGNPADGLFALEVAGKTGGAITAVSDEEVVEGIELLAQTTGIFTETAGGVTTAVLKKLCDTGQIDRNEQVVLFITGDGFKTLDAVADRIHPVHTAPDYDSFEAAVLSKQV